MKNEGYGLRDRLGVMQLHKPFTWQKDSPLRGLPRQEDIGFPGKEGYPVEHVNASVCFLKKRKESWLALTG